MAERKYFLEDDEAASDVLETLGKERTYEMLDLLSDEPYSAPELEEVIEEFHGATIYRRLGELEDLDLVHKRSDETLLDTESEATKYSASSIGEEVVEFFENLY